MPNNEKRVLRKENKEKRITVAVTEQQLNALYDAAERENYGSLAKLIRKSIAYKLRF